MSEQGVIRITTPDGQIKEYDVDFDSAIVGRADGNRIVIPHVSVSRRHAHLTFEDGRLMVEDFSSATGTYINGRQVLAGEKLEIPPGADVRFGEAQALYIAPERVAPPPEPEPEPLVEPAVAAAPPPPPPPVAEPVAAAEPEPVVYSPPPPAPPPPPPRPVAATPPPPAPTPAPEQRAAASAMAAQSDMQQRQYIGVTLGSPPAAVAPGASTAATVNLHNRGQVVDEFTVSVADIPGEWVQIARPRVTLLPGARDELTIIIRPPDGPTGTAGSHRFTVIVQSREHGIDVRSIGEMSVTSFEKVEATLRPLKGKGSFNVEVVNRGNVVAPILIDGSDDEGKLQFDVPEDTHLQPGETRVVPVKVTPRKKPKFGREATTRFQMNVRSGRSGAQPIRLDGSNVYRPPLERWKAPLVALMLILGLGGGSYGVVNACKRDTGICADLLNKTKDQAASPDATATLDATSEASAEASSEATTAPIDDSCPSTRLQPGQAAVMINSESPRTFVRAQPSRDAAVLGQVGDGTKLTTIRCQKAANGEDLIFWEVTLTTPVGGVTSGWIAEQDPGSKQFLISPG